jgi:tetratricopeptide (TPR) repeat protein
MVLLAPAQEPSRPEATSLLGQPLRAPALSAEQRARMEEDLAKARVDYEKKPNDSDAIIWLGRRTAYLGRYRESIAIFSEGIRKHPEDARFYRHRGHRYLTVRELKNAIADLERAAQLIAGRPDEVEPDGQPNPQNIPTSTLQSNIWYHLGLAHYLQGDFSAAERAFTACLKVAENDDNLVAASNWLYLALRKAGRGREAQQVLEPIRTDLKVIENHDYQTLLLMHKGELQPEVVLASAPDDLARATLGYGVGVWYALRGDDRKAEANFCQVVGGPLWPAFGYLAAENELRIRGSGKFICAAPPSGLR